MQVQLTTNKQNSSPAFGKIYRVVSHADISEELGRILIEKGAKPTIDFIAGKLSLSNQTLHLATGEDSFYPPFGMSINGLGLLGEKAKKAGKNVVEIVIDAGKSIAEQLNITLRPSGKKGVQEIDITKIKN